MPSAKITTPVSYWPLRTRAEIDAAAWDIFDNVAGATAHTIRGFDAAGQPDIGLDVLSGGTLVVEKAPYGQVIIKTLDTWEVVTPEQAEARGIALGDPIADPTPDS